MKLTILLTTVCTFPFWVSAQTIVYPTGDPAQDVTAVREAVAGGGTVLLKATDLNGNARAFNFGQYPVSQINWDYDGSGYAALGLDGEPTPVMVGGSTVYVSVGSDVRLLGETVGDAMTTIDGGTVPIRNFAPRMIPGVGNVFVIGLGSFSIENIRFNASALQSIYTYQVGSQPEIREFIRERGLHPNIEIRDNEFHDVEPAYSNYWYALAAVTDGPAGTAHVEGNIVRFTPGRWDAEERAYESQHGLPPRPEIWEGISIADLFDTGHVLHNDVSGVDVGLLVYFDGNSFVRLSNNTVELRPEGFVGISALANHTYLIENNTIIASGLNPDGIVIAPTDSTAGINNSVVRHNHLIMSGSDYGGISMVGAARGNYVAQNIIQGSAAFALGLVADSSAPEMFAVQNRMEGNDLSQFTSRDSSYYGRRADVFLDFHTRRNVVVGNYRLIKDLGKGNSVENNVLRVDSPRADSYESLISRKELIQAPRPDCLTLSTANRQQ